MNNLRVFFAGGLTSYRALFNWLNPWAFLSIATAQGIPCLSAHASILPYRE